MAGESRNSWHQRASAYVAELQAELNRFKKSGDLTIDGKILLEKAEVQLDAAREALNKKDTPFSSISGSVVDRAWTNIHRAELSVLKITDEKELASWGTEVLARVQQHLGAEDPIRRELEKRVESNGRKGDRQFKDLAIRALRAANDAQDFERSRLRSFRNILLTSVLLMSIIAAILAIWGFVEPTALAQNLCFRNPPPKNSTFFCPIDSSPAGGGDVLIVEFFGLCGAALAGAISLRHMRGTATPYMVPICLLLLRLPVGALAAVFGLLIIQGGFVPGFSNLDSSAQVLAWSLVFGVGQETVTRLIDQQGRKIIGSVRGPSRGFDDDLESPPDDGRRVPAKVPPVSVGHRKSPLSRAFRRRN